MAKIKSPAGDVLGQKSPTKGGPGTYDGEKGDAYQKRTPSSNSVPEKIYEDVNYTPMKGIKTPGEKSTKL